MKTLIQNNIVVSFRRNGSWFAALALGFVLATVLAPAAFGQFQYRRLKSFGFPESSGTAPRDLIEGIDGKLYGTTRGAQAVFTVNRDGSGYTVLHTFTGTGGDGSLPNGLREGSDGILYGTTEGGGSADAGTVFKLNKDGSGYTVLHSFAWAEGDAAAPKAALIEGGDGALYGASSRGGSGAGTVFKLNKDGSGYRVLHSFAHPGGGYADSALVEGADGALYGAAGVVFKLNKDGSGFTVLYRVPDETTGDTDGYPRTLIEGADGILYGTALSQLVTGAGHGTLFRLGRDGSGYTVLLRFYYGSHPVLVDGYDGFLYGTYQSGVFKIRKDGTSHTVLHEFGVEPLDGWGPAALIEGSDRALYGSTVQGGKSGGEGTIFRVGKEGSGYTVLRSFSVAGGDGYWPGQRLVEGRDGALYGTSSHGGSHDRGTVFKVDKHGGNYKVLWNYTNSWPGALVEGSDGALYGTSQSGGTTNAAHSSGHGTVFKLQPDGSGYTVLRAFTGMDGDGSLPGGSLLRGSDGAFYGTTFVGGIVGQGTIFKLNEDGTGYSILHRFSNLADGLNPNAALVEGSDGALYGTTTYGGMTNNATPWGRGAVFKLDKDGGNYTVLFRFTASNGWLGNGVIESSDGVLYGTTYSGGSTNTSFPFGAGTVFKLNRSGSGYTVLHRFSGLPNDAAHPAALVEGSDGALYGTTPEGGMTNVFYLPWGNYTRGMGTVFRLNKDGSAYTVLHRFSGLPGDGQTPGGLIIARDGALYGTTTSGGDMGFGTIFALRPQPVMLPPVVSGGGMQVRFSSMPGSTHRLQRASALDGTWLTLTNQMVSTSGVAVFTDFAPPQSSAFYRTVAP